MHSILWICIALSAILFLISFLRQLHHLRNGRNVQPSKLAVCFNWLLIIVFVGSLCGLAWDEFHPQRTSNAATASSSSSSTVTRHANTHYKKVSWRPKDLVLGDDGSVVATFKIPAKTEVKIIGARTKTVYKTFKAKDHDRKVKYKFEYAAKYELEIIDHHGNRKKQILEIKDNNAVANSSTSSQASSSSVTSAMTARATNGGNATVTSQSSNRSATSVSPTAPSTPQTSGAAGTGEGGQQ